jgi:hypothetical protein
VSGQDGTQGPRFGPKRMFWGSDVSRLPCSYRQAVDHFLHELDFIAPTDLPWVMGRGVAQVLRWELDQAAPGSATL